MKDNLTAMVLAQPARFQPHVPRPALAMRISQKNFLKFCKPSGKVGEDFCGNFALIASRTEDAGHQHPSWSV